MAKNWHVRRGNGDDVLAIAGFQQAMARETEGRPLDLPTVTAGISRLLDQPHLGHYLVAVSEDDALVGSLAITYEWSDWRNGLFWWIQSVYVTPSHRRTGVYRALYEHARRESLADSNAIGFRLYVEKENAVAISTYQALGMHTTDYRLLEWLNQ